MAVSLFDRRLYRRRRALSARRFPAHDFLHRRAMADVVDRLETVTRDFPSALFYGAGSLTDMLTPACGVGMTVSADLARERLARSGPCLVYDEDHAAIGEERFDLIVSLLTLHAANDPVGALVQMRRALKPDGLLVAVTFGGDTLAGVRAALYAAEAGASGAVSARVAPMAGVREWGAALQRAGLALPVVDLDRVRATYREPVRVLADLRGMGETAAFLERSRYLGKAAAGALLAHIEAAPTIEFDLVTLTGWAPHPSQPKPLKRGSAALSLADAIGRAGGGNLAS